MNLDVLFQFYDHCIYFFFCIMLAKRETYRYKIGIIIDGSDNMRALIGTTAAGTATGSTDTLHIETKENHLGFFGIWERHIKHHIVSR